MKRALVLVVCAGCSSLLGLDDYRARDAGAVDAAPLPGRDAGVDASCAATEACTAENAVERALDEDCDGWIDEDCVWSVATPHWLTITQVGVVVGSPWLSPDGLRLYFVDRSAGTLWMARRPSARDPFAPADRVFFSTPGVLSIEAATLTAGELEIIVDAGDPDRSLFVATRTVPEEEFVDLQPLPLDRGDGPLDAAPVLSSDGEELFFVSDRTDGATRIHMSLRERDGGAFTTAQLVAFGRAFTATDSPALSLDGRTLFFRGHDAGGAELYYATRDARASAAFGVPTPLSLPGLAGGDGYHFFLSERTGELFFVSSREWSPGDASIWRTRLCRSSACTVEPVACDTGVRSPDAQHCYFPPDERGLVEWRDARAECERLTDSGSVTHLPTVHSAVEAGLVQDARGLAWLGAQETPGGVAWTTGEPDPRGLFAMPMGGETECAAVPSGGVWPSPFTILPCAELHAFTCEREAWPTW